MHSLDVPLHQKIYFRQEVVVEAFLQSHLEYEVKNLAAHAFM